MQAVKYSKYLPALIAASHRLPCNLVRAKQHADGCRIQIAAIFPKGERITPVHEQLCISDDPDLIDHGCFAGLPAKKRGIRLLFEKTDRRRIFLLRLRLADLLRLLCRHSSVIQESRRIPGARLYMRIAAHCGQIQQKCGAQFYILPVPADAFFSFISFHIAHPKIIFPHLRFQPDAAAVIHRLIRRHDHFILTGNAPVSERRIRFVLIQNIHTDFPRPQLLAKHGILLIVCEDIGLVSLIQMEASGTQIAYVCDGLL